MRCWNRIFSTMSSGLPMQFGDRREPLGDAADDRERHGKPERACPDRRLRIAADGDPQRERVLHRPRVHALAGERSAMRTAPLHPDRLADLEEEPELLREELVVVLEVVPEERERFDERPAPR